MSPERATRTSTATARITTALTSFVLVFAVAAGPHASASAERGAVPSAKKKCKKAKGKGKAAGKKPKCKKPKKKPPAPGPGPGPGGAAQLAISPPAHDFGAVVSGNLSADVPFTVTNSGDAPGGPPVPSLSGANPGQFQIAGTTCTGSLAPSQSCSVSARFAPTVTSESTAALMVALPGGASASAALSGTSAARLAINPTSQDWGTVLVGFPVDRFFTVTNTGAATSSALTAAIVGGGSFLITGNTCAGTLSTVGSCDITVTFSPTVPGPRNGVLRVSATAGGIAESQLSALGA